MESDSSVRLSVAELTGKFKGALGMPTEQQRRPERRPPRSLQLRSKTDDGDSEKPAVSPHPPKVKMKNAQLMEKLQANLALSPTALLPSPKSPEVKLPAGPASPPSPCSPPTPGLLSEEEEPVSFEKPAEGTPLPSINKSRARLSIKRRPPSRQHRRSAGEEARASGGDASPSEPPSPQENGEEDQVFEEAGQEEGGRGNASPQPDTVREAEERDRVEAEAPSGCVEGTGKAGPAFQEGEESGEQPQASSAQPSVPLDAIKEQGLVGSCPAEGSSTETEEQDVATQLVDREDNTKGPVLKHCRNATLL